MKSIKKLSCQLFLVSLLSIFIQYNAFYNPGFRISRSTVTSKENTVLKTRQQRGQLLVHYGIPKLFRWLVDLYPVVLESVGEGLSGNAMQVDNFYLDMNGIIHTCTHTNNDKLVTLNEREMFQR
jgi:hypothetical protein